MKPVMRVLATPRARCGALALGLLWAVLCGLVPGVAAAPARKTPAVAASPAITLDMCGALTVDPGLPPSWPTGRGVRPGEAVSPEDKGFGCRFTLAAAPSAAPVLVEARLRRPGPADGPPVEDRWLVPAHPGEPAAAVSVFYPPGRAAPGAWTLELYLDGVRLAARTFTVAAPATAAPAMVTPATVASAPVAPAGVEPDRKPETAPGDNADGPPEAAPAGSSAPPPPAPATPAAPAPALAPEAGPAAASSTSGKKAGPASKAQPPARTQERGGPVPPPARNPAPAKAAGASAPSPVSAKPTTPEKPAATGYWALQTGLFADAANAASQAAKLRRRGFPACVAVEKTGKGSRYRVLAGRFGDRRAALATRHAVAAAGDVSPLLFQVSPDLAARVRCE